MCNVHLYRYEQLFQLLYWHARSDGLMTIDTELAEPILRITRYPLLLGDIRNIFAKANVEARELSKKQKDTLAVLKESHDLSQVFAQYVNDVMNAGRIGNYPVSKVNLI